MLWQPAFSLRESLQAEGPLHGRVGQIMIELGWPPVILPYHEQIESIVEAYEEYESTGDEELLANLRGEVERFLLDHYGDQELLDILNEWERHPLLTARLAILRAAVQAHIEGKYELSVPAILPHVEGILAQAFTHTGRMRSRNYQEYVDRLTSDLLRGYDEATRKFITDYLLATFEWGGTPGSDLSRHAVLHGYDTGYATRAKSLKVILVFDHIQQRLRHVTAPGDDLYHLIECPRLAGVADTDRAYVLQYDALLAGRHPCPACLPDAE